MYNVKLVTPRQRLESSFVSPHDDEGAWLENGVNFSLRYGRIYDCVPRKEFRFVSSVLVVTE